MPCLQHRKTERRLTRCTRSQASSSVSRTDASSSGEIPALLKSTSMRPKRSRTSAYRPRTAPSSVTSATMAWSTVRRGADVDADDLRALGAQAGARRRADAARGARDDADLAVHAPGHQLPSVAMKIVLTSV